MEVSSTFDDRISLATTILTATCNYQAANQIIWGDRIFSQANTVASQMAVSPDIANYFSDCFFRSLHQSKNFCDNVLEKSHLTV